MPVIRSASRHPTRPNGSQGGIKERVTCSVRVPHNPPLRAVGQHCLRRTDPLIRAESGTPGGCMAGLALCGCLASRYPLPRRSVRGHG